MEPPIVKTVSISRNEPFRVASWLWLALVIGLICGQCRTADPTPSLSVSLVQAVSLENTLVLSSKLDSIVHTWTLYVPYLTNLRALKPILTLADGVSVIPHSGEVQDFTKPVQYTVTNAKGEKIVYTLLVQSVIQPPARLLSTSVDTLEAGQSLRLIGHSFGSFGPDVRVIATGPNNQTSVLPTTLLDSTQLQVNFPVSLAPGRYDLSVLVRNLPSLNKLMIHVQYPSPQLLSLNRQHLRGGDSLQVQGLYINPTVYRYGLRVSNGQNGYFLAPTTIQSDALTIRLDPQLPAGRYWVQVVNQSENKVSRDTTVSFTLYDQSKPFITGVSIPKATYEAGELVRLKTVNLLTISTRFYQLQLANNQHSYAVNGIYDATQQQISLIIPMQIAKGTYTLSVYLLDSSDQVLYHFDTDERFVL